MVGDILLVQTRKGPAYMQVEGITNIAGKAEIRKYKKAIGNITALNKINNGDRECKNNEI